MAITRSKKKAASARIFCILLVVMVVGHVSSDFADDQKECQDKLIGLSPCLTFVGGDSRAPTPACCSDLKKDYNNTRRCLCLLVKDRNEANLSIKINSTLALSLPFICHVPSANTSDCPALLHLDPDSPDAQVFEQFSNTSVVNGDNTGIGEIPTSSSTTLKGIWIEFRKVGRVSYWLLLVSVFISYV